MDEEILILPQTGEKLEGQRGGREQGLRYPVGLS